MGFSFIQECIKPACEEFHIFAATMHLFSQFIEGGTQKGEHCLGK